MRKIAKGYRFDTEKAVALGTARRHPNNNLWEAWEATLYLSSSNRFFLHGIGGGMTIWGMAWATHAKSDAEAGDGRYERIIPLGRRQARDWAERFLSKAQCEHLFKISKDLPPPRVRRKDE